MATPSRLAPAPFARPLGPMAAAGWSAAFVLVYALAGAVFVSIRPGAEFDGVSDALIQAACVLVIVYGIARFHAPLAPTSEVIGARSISLVSSFGAAMMGAAAMIPLAALQGAISHRFPIVGERAQELGHGLAAMGRSQRIAGVLAMALVAPLADELLFRGAIATGLARDKGRRVALVTSALSFSFAYSLGDWHYAPLGFAAGLILGHVRFATGSVIASIGAALAWRAADLANDVRVTGTIDPLVTSTFAYPTYPVPLVVGTSVATLALGYVLHRLGHADGDDKTPPVPVDPSAHPSEPPADEEDDD